MQESPIGCPAMDEPVTRVPVSLVAFMVGAPGLQGLAETTAGKVCFHACPPAKASLASLLFFASVDFFLSFFFFPDQISNALKIMFDEKYYISAFWLFHLEDFSEYFICSAGNGGAQSLIFTRYVLLLSIRKGNESLFFCCLL